jgi:hypothetical protein
VPTFYLRDELCVDFAILRTSTVLDLSRITIFLREMMYHMAANNRQSCFIVHSKNIKWRKTTRHHEASIWYSTVSWFSWNKLFTVRGVCSFWWYWWNSWPSLFTPCLCYWSSNNNNTSIKQLKYLNFQNYVPIVLFSRVIPKQEGTRCGRRWLRSSPECL